MNKPGTWEMASLGSLCTRLVDGSHNPPSASAEGLPMLSARNVQGRQIVFDEYRLIDPKSFEVEHARTRVAPGDVLLTIVGAIGRVAVVREPEPFALQRSVAVLKPDATIESRFLAYALEAPMGQKYLQENAKGTAQKGVYLKVLKDLPVALAPLPEQKRIADKLDGLLARVDACRTRLDGVLTLLRRFRQAVLDAATSGTLTEEWRAREGISIHWREVTVGAVTADLRYGTSKKCEYDVMGTPVLRIPNIADHGRLDVADLKRSHFDDAEIRRLVIQPGDLLLIRSNGSVDLVGKTSVVTDREAGMLFAGYLMRLRVDPTLAEPRFMQIWLSSPRLRTLIEQASKSTSGVNNLNAEELRGMPLALPSLAEQAEIVRQVESLFALADSVEVRYQVARARVDRLTSALLAKAFRGQLVPQDPNDEPADVLLARLRGDASSGESGHAAKRRSSPRSPKRSARALVPLPTD